MGRWVRDDAALYDLLSLVMHTPPPRITMATWPNIDAHSVETWASHEYLAASDNPVRRLPVPDSITRSVGNGEALL